jgi:hypothetical protein
MKLRDLVKIFRDEVDDVTEPFLWTEEELIDYANDAENEACRRSRLLIDSTTVEICQIAVTANTAGYALDPRVIFVRRAKLATKSLPLGRASVRDLDDETPGWDAHTGTVSAYIPDHDTGKLRLYRIPTVNDTLNLTVVRLPLEAMENLDAEPEIHRRYQRNLRHWLKWRAYSKQDAETMDEKKAAAGLALFEQEFGKASPALDEEWINREQGYDRWDGTF